MASDLLSTQIEFLKGVGPQRAELLKKELAIHTFLDLLLHYPFRYVDRTRFYKVSEIRTEMPYVQLKGQIVAHSIVGLKRARRLVATFRDSTGTIELVWFQGIKWVAEKLAMGGEFIVFGKPAVFNGKFNIPHPELDIATDENTIRASALQPVYPTTEKLKSKGIDSKAISRMVRIVVSQMERKIPETLSLAVLEENHLLSKEHALRLIHFPSDPDSLRKAQFRVKFEELFFIQLRLIKVKKVRAQALKGILFSKVGDNFNRFFTDHLPFPLTDAQKRVIKEIRIDTGSGRQMNRLLQGDVGSGKTIVALMSMLLALDNGCQSCLMAPTEILANQHYQSLSEMLKPMGIPIALLTGSTRAAQRRTLLAGVASGEIPFLVGTHALIEDSVQFSNLGLTVIDEQHRFGVDQRARLWSKGKQLPHVLVMTATPIPRTLAMTLYGDLDVSVIDQLPPGRKPVKTIHRYDSARIEVFAFMKQQIAMGRQIYVVYPLIRESEKMDYKDLMDGYESIVRAFPQPEYQVSIVHGQMKNTDRDFEMQRFLNRQTQIMVATTVIEVGVNVPNASVMIIESAERFGLSQLHQLRGRVGRGADQSYCILMTSYELSNETRTRVETMVRTNDGFEIAEVDLRLRGPGDIEGTQQSGVVDLRLADLSKDAAILQKAREVAIKLLDSDPDLVSPVNYPIAARLRESEASRNFYSRVS